MKRIFFIVMSLAIAISSLTSCNSAEDVIEEAVLQPQDTELTVLFNSIDSVQNEYTIGVETRVNWEKWARRGMSCLVDGVVGALFAETGPVGSLIAGGIGSGLYEDYLDYMVSKGKKRRSHRITRSTLSPINAVVLSQGQASFVDSIGYYHNVILNEIKVKGITFTDNSGNINYRSCCNEVLLAARKNGIRNNCNINNELLYEYLESIIKPLARLETGDQTQDINQEIIFSILFNDIFNKFGFSKTKALELRNVCEKIIYNSMSVNEDQLVDYGTEINKLIVNSDVTATTKDNLKIANNIAINSSLYWSGN